MHPKKIKRHHMKYMTHAHAHANRENKENQT